jgi:hypothetical protein
MMKFPLPDGGIFAVIEPGNIRRLKDGRPLIVGNCMIAFTPDMQRFTELLGMNGDMPKKGTEKVHFFHLTPGQISTALEFCKDMPEVDRA